MLKWLTYKTCFILAVVFLTLAVYSERSNAKVNTDNIEAISNDPYKVEAKLLQPKERIVLNLDSQIEGPGAYTDIINMLDSLSVDQTVVLKINSPGGSVLGGIPLVNSLLNTKARVEVEITGGAFSMAAIIACTGDTIKMDPGTILMFHDYSVSSVGGKGSELIELTTAISEMLKESANAACSNLLTPKEIEDFMSGKDLYLHPKDVADRLKGK
jgi:ATP-dependent protease ClpP protease subunit